MPVDLMIWSLGRFSRHLSLAALLLTHLKSTVAAWIKLAKFEPGVGLPLDTASPRQIITAVNSAAQPNILQSAIEGIVLVKNRDNALPLRKPKMLALYGYDGQAPSKNHPAGPNTKYDLGFSSVNVTDAEMQGLFIGYGELPGAAYLGTLVSGGGSASSVPAYIDSPYAAFQRRAKDDGTFLIWDFDSQDPSPASPGTDACLVFINEFAAEGQDRSTVADSWSDQLIMNVAAKCPNVSTTSFSHDDPH
jgi:beta-glucosidase